MRGTVLFAAFLFLAAGPTPAQDAQSETRAEAQEAERSRAVARGLAYLAKQQSASGDFGSGGGRVGISALALLAFMAAGHQENRGPYGAVLRRGVDRILKWSKPPGKRDPLRSGQAIPAGYIWVPGDADSRMHGHGYATQVLVLAYGTNRAGTDRARELKTKIRRAVRVIENSQTLTGGWGYQPHAHAMHEGSVTVTVVQALRMARDCGFVVDREVHRRGLEYLKKSQTRNGSFRYRLTSDTTSEALTAAALTAMYGFGEYYSKSVKNGLDFLERGYRQPWRILWTYYANYYAAQAFHRAGGRYRRLWVRTVRPYVLSLQEADGAWDDEREGRTRKNFGKTHSTAFAVLALCVEEGKLPLFQK